MKHITSWQVSVFLLLIAALGLLPVACRSESLEEEIPPGLNDTSAPQGEIPVENNVAPDGQAPVEQQPADQQPPAEQPAVEQQPVEQQPPAEQQPVEQQPAAVPEQDVPDLVEQPVDPNAGQGDPNAGQSADPNAGQVDPNAGQAEAAAPPAEQQPQEAAPPVEQQPAPAQSETRVHVVRPRDTIGAIADYYEVSADSIMAANGMSNNIIYPEQELIIPAADGSFAPQAEAAAGEPPFDPDLGTEHIVQPGEVISTIAQQYNMSYLDLAAYNALPDPYYIYAGQRLFIPHNR